MSDGSLTAKRVVVVGGGVAGLAAAHRIIELARKDHLDIDLLLLEAMPRLGGSIITHHHDGFLVEGGPDSFITQKPAALALCRRIGIDHQLVPTDAHRRRVYVVRKGRLHAIPEGFLLLAPTRIWPFITSRLFSWPGKIRMGMDVILPARRLGPDDDESLAEFVRRRFGLEALERIAQPLVGGIYTADPETLSLRTTMPRFLELEARYRSVILGMRKGPKAMTGHDRGDSGARYSMFVSFAQGMSTLIEALAGRLPQGSLRTGVPVQRIERSGNRWAAVLADGSAEVADAVILACPAYASARMLKDMDSGLSGELAGIRYASSATMTMAFRRDQIRHPLDGFGYVVPVVEGRSMIAGTFGSIKFPGRAPDGWVLMRAFLGGAVQPHIYELDDDRLKEAVLRDLAELIGIAGEPRFVELHRWPSSMPQYPVGHLKHVARMDRLTRAWPGLALAGNAFTGVGIPDCIQSGEVAAGRIIEGFIKDVSRP